MQSSMSLNARGLPLISRPTSKPSMCSSFITSFSDVLATLTTRVAPMSAASFRRKSLTSVTTTLRAPMCLQMPAAMMPIGPAPVISTSSPMTLNSSAQCAALPYGSKKAASSDGIWSGIGHRLLAGITMYSANAPLTLTPMPTVFGHRCGRPPRQLRQWPQTMWPSADTRWPIS
ncbi:hypothetical protein D3C73_1264570 [compost metagenome]